MITITRPLLLVAIILLGAGCAKTPRLPPTPNLYLDGRDTALVDTPPDRATVDVELLYATDRKRRLFRFSMRIAHTLSKSAGVPM